jgi:VWFA-related protein
MPAHMNLVRYMALAACALLAGAQPPAPASKVLNVVAFDAKGHAVTDLTSADFQIFDDGKPQQIASFEASAAHSARGGTTPPTILIIFDLLNATHLQREYISSLIVRALEPLEQGDSVYLYLLTNNGTPYPVHALPATTWTPAGAPWTRQIHPLLDRAVQDVFGFRLKDYADTGIRVGATFQTLADLGMQLTRISGAKTIVWITMGAPNRVAYPFGCRDVAFAGESGSYLAGKCRDGCACLRGNQCIDYTPFLGHFSRELERTGTIFSSVEELAAGSFRGST